MPRSTDEKQLVLNTSYRSNKNLPNSNCSLSLNGVMHMQSTEGIRVHSVSIPNMFPNVYGMGTQLYLECDGEEKVYTIPAGHYATIDALAQAAQAPLLECVQAAEQKITIVTGVNDTLDVRLPDNAWGTLGDTIPAGTYTQAQIHTILNSWIITNAIWDWSTFVEGGVTKTRVGNNNNSASENIRLRNQGAATVGLLSDLGWNSFDFTEGIIVLRNTIVPADVGPTYTGGTVLYAVTATGQIGFSFSTPIKILGLSEIDNPTSLNHLLGASRAFQQVVDAVTFPNPASLIGVRKVYVSSNKLAFGNSVHSKGHINSEFASVSLHNVPYGTVAYVEPPDFINTQVWFRDTQDINTIDITLTDEFDQILDLPDNQYAIIDLVVGSKT